MRVGIVSTPWLPVPPPLYGGTEAVVDCLSRGLVAVGHDVVLATTGESSCPVRRVDAVPTAQMHRIGASNVELRHTVRAYAAFAELDVDVIHDHTITGPLYRHRPPGIPLAATNHGPFLADLVEIYRAISRDAAVVAISHAQAATAQGVPIAAVIHHGIDIDQVPVGDGRGGYALCLGRMSPDKGIREAVLVARQVDIPLLIVAKMREDSEYAYFDEQVKPLLGPESEYVGEIGDAEKYRIMGEAVALLNPIQWPEPFGLVMIEALACGTPVVATRRGAAPEIVRDGVTGFLRASPEELAAALAAASALSRSACRRDAEKRFSTLRMVDDHVRLYDRLLTGGAIDPVT